MHLDRVDLSRLTVEDFAPYVGEVFVVSPYPEGEVFAELKLTDASVTGKVPWGDRHPFRLGFEGPASQALGQEMFTMQHPSIGKLDIFIVPVRGDTETRGYEAIFT